jgi:hypothetical protein
MGVDGSVIDEEKRRLEMIKLWSTPICLQVSWRLLAYEQLS